MNESTEFETQNLAITGMLKVTVRGPDGEIKGYQELEVKGPHD